MRLKIFVRWDKSHDDAGGTVEVQAGDFVGPLSADWLGQFTTWSKRCGNNERVYGYCMALVDMFSFQGHKIEMPHCLQGHTGPNLGRED
jgi:hypothetical protein